MADITSNPTSFGPSNNLVLRAARAIWTWLVHLGEATAIARALQDVQQTSDAELSRRGLTRQDAVRQVLMNSGHV